MQGKAGFYRVTVVPSTESGSHNAAASNAGPSDPSQKGAVAPVVLCILDGWGYRHDDVHNAIRAAQTPVMDALWHAYPHTLIEASGADVGLPDDQMGNSEVGHLTIGAGRIIRQELVRISQAVRDGSIADNSELNALAEQLQSSGKTLHLIGLCSDGGVHSHIDHLGGLLHWAKARGLKDVCIHAITDGRDTPPQSAEPFLTKIEAQIEAAGIGRISTLCGRYWAMDRDSRWERTEKAYRLLTEDGAITEQSPQEVLQASYGEEIYDEFLEPTRLAPGSIQSGDGLVVFNFRPDRVRQLVKALVLENFDGFERSFIPDLNVVTFTQYEAGLPVSVAFPPESLDGLLGQVVSEAGLRQFRTAETEKYPHVTYFMNGGIEQPYPGEDRHLVPSPRVATYDQAPAMSAEQLTDNCISAINKGIYSLVVINYANPDMVGHTGAMEATVEAIGAVDQSVGRLLEATNRMGGTLIVTADHGNAELMEGPDGLPWTAHTTNPVPLILVEGEKRKIPGHGTAVELRSGGGLADVAPTLLEILGLEQPSRMTGTSLIHPLGSPSQPSRIPQTLGV